MDGRISSLRHTSWASSAEGSNCFSSWDFEQLRNYSVVGAGLIKLYGIIMWSTYSKIDVPRTLTEPSSQFILASLAAVGAPLC